MNRAQITALDRLAARAWPADGVEHLDGWRLRTSPTSSRRVNSVLPLAPVSEAALPESIAKAEGFYRARNAPPRFQISPAAMPRDLDTELERRGWTIEAPTLLLTAGAESLTASLAAPSDVQVSLAAAAGEAWAAACWPEMDQAEREARHMLVQRILPAHRFAAVEVDGAVAAIGLGVRDGQWLGIFCMRSAAMHRRKGLARAVLGALVAWGAGLGARSLYLQVEADNAAAIKLYESAGFLAAYGYHYRKAPD